MCFLYVHCPEVKSVIPILFRLKLKFYNFLSNQNFFSTKYPNHMKYTWTKIIPLQKDGYLCFEI